MNASDLPSADWISARAVWSKAGVAIPAERTPDSDHYLSDLTFVVVISPTEGGFEIELSGDITNMIKLPEGSSIDRHKSSVKVVAGEGFEPPTFRL